MKRGGNRLEGLHLTVYAFYKNGGSIREIAKILCMNKNKVNRILRDIIDYTAYGEEVKVMIEEHKRRGRVLGGLNSHKARFGGNDENL